MFEFILLCAFLGLLLTAAWWDTLWIAGAALVVYGAVSWLFTDMSHMAWLADPVTLAALLAVSMGIGTLWSLWKWRRHVRSDSVQAALKRELKSYHKYYRVSPDSKAPRYIDSTYFPNEARASWNVEKISTWIILWPFSMIVYFFEDFLVDIARWIYERFAKIYARITLSALSDDMK